MNVDVLKIGRTYSDLKPYGVPNAQLSVGEGNLPSVPVYVPEGRVHGGSLMALLTASSDLGSSRGKGVVVASSEPTKSYSTTYGWM
jgi:hypothetical protein